MAFSHIFAQLHGNLIHHARESKDRYEFPIHIVNELVTPEVRYDSWQEFVHLVYVVQDVFCALLEVSVREELETQHLSPVLGSVFCSTPTLARVKAEGPAIIQLLTKNKGEFWCEMVSHFVCCRALRAAAIFDDVQCSICDTLQLSPRVLQGEEKKQMLISIMQQVVRHTFSGAMPFSIYTLCSGFVSTLLVKNFTFYADEYLTAFTHAQFADMLLALCMGLHQRLGENSCLLPVTSDILRLVSASLSASQLEKHIVFHTQEQWLY